MTSAMRSEYLGMSWLCQFGILCRRSWRNCLQQLCPGGKPGKGRMLEVAKRGCQVAGGLWLGNFSDKLDSVGLFWWKHVPHIFVLSESSREFLFVRGVRKTHQKKKGIKWKLASSDDFPLQKLTYPLKKMMVGRRSFPFETCHYLGGGFKYFLFSPLFGEDSQFK